MQPSVVRLARRSFPTIKWYSEPTRVATTIGMWAPAAIGFLFWGAGISRIETKLSTPPEMSPNGIRHHKPEPFHPHN